MAWDPDQSTSGHTELHPPRHDCEQPPDTPYHPPARHTGASDTPTVSASGAQLPETSPAAAKQALTELLLGSNGVAAQVPGEAPEKEKWGTGRPTTPAVPRCHPGLGRSPPSTSSGWPEFPACPLSQKLHRPPSPLHARCPGLCLSLHEARAVSSVCFRPSGASLPPLLFMAPPD